MGNCRLIDKLTTDFNLYNNCAQKFIKKSKDKVKDERGINTPGKNEILENKKEIMECCLKKCENQTENFDCKKYCKFYQDLIINPEKISPEYAKIIESQKNKSIPFKYKLYRDKTVIWIILGVIFGIILTAIILLIKNN